MSQLEDFRDVPPVRLAGLTAGGQVLNSLECEGLSGDCFSDEQLEEALDFAAGDYDEAMVYLCGQAENQGGEPDEWMPESCDPEYMIGPGAAITDLVESEISNSEEEEDLLESLDSHQETPPAPEAGPEPNSPPSEENVCRNGHPIELSTSTDGVYALGNWYCDICGTSRPPGTERWLCKLCSYDVCKRCIPSGDGEPDDEPEPPELPSPSRMQRLLRQSSLSGMFRLEQLEEMEAQLGPDLLRAVERQLGPAMMLEANGGLPGLAGLFNHAEMGLMGDMGDMGDVGAGRNEDVCADDSVDWPAEVSNLGLTGADTMATHELACHRIIKRCGMGLRQFCELCQLGLLEQLSQVLGTTQAHSEDSNTLSSAVSLASTLASVALDWKETDELVVCQVTSSRGVAHRRTPVFSDRVGHGSFVPSGAIVTGVVVQGNNTDTRYLRGTNGFYLPMERPAKSSQKTEQLIVELDPQDSAVIVSGAGEPSVNAVYELQGLLDGAMVYCVAPVTPDTPQMHLFRTGCSSAYRWTLALMSAYSSPSDFRAKNLDKVFYRCNKSASETPPSSGWTADAYDSGVSPSPVIYSVLELQQAAAECHDTMKAIQPQVLSLLLPSLLQSYELVQPLALERQLVTVVEAIVQRLSEEQLQSAALVELGTHRQLCAFVKQLFETDSLATAMQGLKLTEMLLSTSPPLVREMLRHGLVPAIANLKACRDKQRHGLMRTLSGTTRPDSVSKLASRLITLVESVEESQGGISSEGEEITQALGALSTELGQCKQEAGEPLLAQLAERIHQATPYELHSNRVPCALLQWVTAEDGTSAGHWSAFERHFGPDSEALRLLIERLHHIVSECEDLPVYTQPDHRFGLSSLLQPCELALSSAEMASTVHVQPLVRMLQVKHHMLRTMPIKSEVYLAWCAKLLRAKIRDRGMYGQAGKSVSRVAHVLAATYCNADGLVAHTLQYEGSQQQLQVVLASRDYLVISLNDVKVESTTIKPFAQPGQVLEDVTAADREYDVVIQLPRSGFTDREAVKQTSAEDMWQEELAQCTMITELPRELCLQGLKLANGNLEMAINLLFNGQVPMNSSSGSVPSSSTGGPSTIWELKTGDNSWSDFEPGPSAILESAYNADKNAQPELTDGAHQGIVVLERMVFVKQGSTDDETQVRRVDLDEKLKKLMDQGIRTALIQGSLERSQSSSALSQLYHNDGAIPLHNSAISYLQQCVELLVHAHGHAVLLAAEPHMWLRAVTDGRSPSLGSFMQRTFEQVLEHASANGTFSVDVRRASQMLHPAVLMGILGESGQDLSPVSQIALAVFINSVIELLMYVGQIMTKAYHMDEISVQLLVATLNPKHNGPGSDGPTRVMIEDLIAVLKDGAEMVMNGVAAHGPMQDKFETLFNHVMAAQTSSIEGTTPCYSSQPGSNYTLRDRGFPGDAHEFASTVAALQIAAKGLPDGQDKVELDIAVVQTEAEATAVCQMLTAALEEHLSDADVKCIKRKTTHEKSLRLLPALPTLQDGGSKMRTGQRVQCEKQEANEESSWMQVTIIDEADEGKVFAVVSDEGTVETNVPASRLRIPKVQSRSPLGRTRSANSSVPLERAMAAFERHDKDGKSTVNRIEVAPSSEESSSDEQSDQQTSHPEVSLRFEFSVDGLPSETCKKSPVSTINKKDPATIQLPDDASFFQCIQMLYHNHHRKALTQAPWRRRYELKYTINVLNVGPGCLLRDTALGLEPSMGRSLPWPSDDTLCSAVESQSASKEEFVQSLQHLGRANWLHKMGLLGPPNVVASLNQWQRLFELYRSLCSAPRSLDSGRQLLLPPPTAELPQRLKNCGLQNPEARAAVTLLALLHQQFVDKANLKWVNRKLTSKLRYQLEDALSMTTQVLPKWCFVVPHSLLDFSVRKDLFECTSYGVSHSLYWMQERLIRRKQLRSQEQFALEREFLASVQAGQLKQDSTAEQKQQAEMELMQAQAVSVEIRERIREHQLGTLRVEMAKVPDLKNSEALLHLQQLFETHSSSRSVLEMTQNRDQAFGSGVTQECYTCIAALQMQSTFSDSHLVFLPTGCIGKEADALVEVPNEGLFPRPIDIENPESVTVATSQWRFIGRLLARALRDNYTVPLPLSTAFFKLVLSSVLGPADLPSVAPVPIKGLSQLAQLLESQNDVDINKLRWSTVDPSCSDSEDSVADVFTGLGLVFRDEWITQLDLHPGGEDEEVELTAGSLRRFVDELCELWFHRGVAKQVEAFRQGMSDVFEPRQVQLFEPRELRKLLCTDTQVCWAWPNPPTDTPQAQVEEAERQSLFQYLHPIAGYTRESSSFHHLVGALVQLDNEQRKDFLHFVTAKRGLDPGGLPSMKVQIAKPIHITSPLPAARSCNNTLFLPESTSVEEVKNNLILASSLESCAHTQGMSDQIFQ